MQAGEARCVFVPGNVITGDDLPPRRAFLDSLFYREFLRPQDIHDVCGGMLHDGSEPGIPRIHVAVYRSLSRAVFGEADKEVMRSLVPAPARGDTHRLPAGGNGTAAFRHGSGRRHHRPGAGAGGRRRPHCLRQPPGAASARGARRLVAESGRLLACAPAQRIALEKMVRSHSPLESMMRISGRRASPATGSCAWRCLR
ncbi:MAG: hypothetical protein M5R42_12435 [Rhodocyclaceae bacterium]|nr:hypothetical protein [Rhodocyclaceae bacterium]